jgi:hypothetical protein
VMFAAINCLLAFYGDFAAAFFKNILFAF